ncbi:MAG: glycosyltransferase 87 family protein [Promethearchaeota archaeon]
MQDKQKMAILPSKSHFDKDFKLLLLSLFFNLIIHLILGFLYYNPVDFVLQFEAAKKIAQGQLLYRDIGELMTDVGPLPKPQYPPLYLYTLGFIIAIVGVKTFTWQMVKLFLIIFNLLVGILVYFIVSDCLPSHPKAHMLALIAMNWFLLNPITLAVIFSGFHDNFMLFFVLSGFLLLRKNHYSASGLCFGLALLVKPIAGIYMLPLVIWGINEQKIQTIIIWFGAGLTFLLGSLPFLFLAPEEYLNDVFFVHAERLDPSMSFYTYFFSETSKTILPFIIQILLFGGYAILILQKMPISSSKRAIEAVLPFMTIFMAFNRILYPHYVPFFFPFYSFVFIFLIAEQYSPKQKQNGKLLLGLLLGGLVLVYLGGSVWSLGWIIEGYETYWYNPLFSISACVCILGLILISLTSLYSLYGIAEKNDIREENRT